MYGVYLLNMLNKFLLTQILEILLVNKFYLIILSTLLGGANKNSYVISTCLNISVISSVNLVNNVPPEHNQMDSEDMNFVKYDPASSKFKNSDILKDLDQKLSHPSSDKRLELKQLILEYEHLFPDIPSKTDKFIVMLILLIVQNM